MILFKENGRLGNQIFQYCGLRTIAKPGETLCLFGFEDLQSVFTGMDAEIINQSAKKYKRSIYYRLYSYAEKLAERNVVSFITEDQGRNILETSALFHKIKMAKDVFLQSESLFNADIAKRLSIKKNLYDKAKDLLTSLTNSSHPPVFVHVRRGDYLYWPDTNYPAVLPKKFYDDCIAEMKRRFENPYFIFTSDEPDYVKSAFSEIEPKYVSEQSVAMDFALMSQCKGGILSPSSLSWWTAYQVNKNSKNALLLAPEYWIGHRKSQWYPKNIETSFICYRQCEHSRIKLT